MPEKLLKYEIWNNKRQRDDLMPARTLVYVVPAGVESGALMTALAAEERFRGHVETAELNPDFPVDAAVMSLAGAVQAQAPMAEMPEEIQEALPWRLPRPTEGRHSLNTSLVDSGVY